MLFQTRVYRQVMPKTFTEIDIVPYDNNAFKHGCHLRQSSNNTVSEEEDAKSLK